jgi:hypothetical protein
MVSKIIGNPASSDKPLLSAAAQIASDRRQFLAVSGIART